MRPTDCKAVVIESLIGIPMVTVLCTVGTISKGGDGRSLRGRAVMRKEWKDKGIKVE